MGALGQGHSGFALDTAVGGRLQGDSFNPALQLDMAGLENRTVGDESP